MIMRQPQQSGAFQVHRISRQETWREDFVMTEQKLYQFCDTMAASEYRSLIRPFLDISTLSARLKAEECISTEYRMCDGSWHRMLFTVKRGMSLEM